MSAQRASYWSALNFKLLFAQANSLSVPVNSLLCQRIRYLYITVLLGCISIQHIKNLSGKSSMFRKQLQAFDVFLREGDKRWLLATAKCNACIGCRTMFATPGQVVINCQPSVAFSVTADKWLPACTAKTAMRNIFANAIHVVFHLGNHTQQNIGNSIDRMQPRAERNIIGPGFAFIGTFRLYRHQISTVHGIYSVQYAIRESSIGLFLLLLFVALF